MADPLPDHLPLSEDGKRRVTLNPFKGQIYISIREHYQTPSGEMKPGTKGLNLSLEEWKAFKSVASKINDALEEQRSQ